MCHGGIICLLCQNHVSWRDNMLTVSKSCVLMERNMSSVSKSYVMAIVICNLSKLCHDLSTHCFKIMCPDDVSSVSKLSLLLFQ